MSIDQDGHYEIVVNAFAEGRVVPLLGAGVNLCGRPDGATWDRRDPQFLPSGRELAAFLASYFRYPPAEARDLARVSQYGAVMQGLGPLYAELHEIFDADYAPSPLHTFLAELPGTLREKGSTARYQLIVTTNYDDALETAFRNLGEPFDLVSYVADGESRGKFMHCAPDEKPHLIDRPNEYTEVSTDKRTVILKIHGAVDRNNLDAESDSYVITEDHYIDYLTRTDLAGLLPVKIAMKLKRSHFLFLGYGMRDWNLRVILHRIWGQQKLNYKSWAIQVEPEPIEREFWQQRGVEIRSVPLDEYVKGLRAQLAEPFGVGIG